MRGCRGLGDGVILYRKITFVQGRTARGSWLCRYDFCAFVPMLEQ